MKTFISHTHQDKQLATDIAGRFTGENVWFDTWNMDSGDIILNEIERGIDEAKNFLLILSRNSAKSDWVKYELNMGILKYLKEEDYRIIVAKVDDVEVPLKLQAFHYIDVSRATDPAAVIFAQITKIHSSTSPSYKRQFVNRNHEIGSIEDALYDNDIKFISIIGLYGIGKKSLLREALKRVVSNSRMVELTLSTAHFGSRLTLELCSRAGIELPPDGASKEILRNSNIMAVETILGRNDFLVLNKIETLLSDEGDLQDDIRELIDHFKDVDILRKVPIFLLSTRWPNFRFIPKTDHSVIRINGLTDKHLTNVISSEISRIDPAAHYPVEKISSIAALLHGYPLAAKLAAPLVVKYGTDYLSADFRLLQKLKIDIAEEIISKVQITDNETAILEVLAIFGHQLKAKLISSVTELDEDSLSKSIENLVSLNLLSSDGKGLLLHPLISDYYHKAARGNGKFQVYAEQLSNLSIEIFKSLKPTDIEYVYWLTNACRMLFYCNRLSEAHLLRSDLIGELKDAAIKLYHDLEYGRSLELCNEFLATVPKDKDILFIKARCLSRMGIREDSILILKELLTNESNRYLKAKFNFALGRTIIENSQREDKRDSDLAKRYLLKSISLNEHESALQSLGELLLREENYAEAESFIERKLDLSPADPFALSVYSEILWQTNRKAEAIEKITDALRYKPNSANFNFRAGRFLLESDRPLAAYGFFTKAVNNDETYLDARLSLCDACVKLDRFEEAKGHLAYLKSRVKKDKQAILDTISAGYYLKVGEIMEAENAADRALRSERNVVTLGLMAKILLHKSRQNKQKGLTLISESDKQRANELIKEGLELDGANTQLNSMLSQT